MCHRYGDAAVLVDVVADGYEDRWGAAIALADWLRGSSTSGVEDVIATYVNVVVLFDPLVTDYERVQTAILAQDVVGPTRGANRDIEIPVCFGGEYGPDLAEVADDLGMSSEGVVAFVTDSPWTVRFTASPAGAPFLEGPHFPRSVPRMAQPRPRVPRGSVALSGSQCTMYPVASPSGWRHVGRTPALLVEFGEHLRVPYRPGDTVRLTAIDATEWARWEQCPPSARVVAS